MKVLAVVNPISGGIDKEPYLKHFQQELNKYGIGYEIFFTSGKNDQQQLRNSIKTYKPDRIASIGGDGTALSTARSLLDSDIPFGIMPLGSANGMATELGVEPDPRMALSDFLKSNLTCPLDLILVNEKYYCLHIGDVGINANIVEDFSKEEERGMTAYAKHFFDRIIRKELITMRLFVDGKVYEEIGYMAAFANARKYGTGVVLNYNGNPTDGRFEVVILREADTKTLIKAGLSRFREELAKENNVATLSCKQARIELDRPQTLQLDGEVIGKVSEISGKVVSSAVQIVTTTKNPFTSNL